MNHTPGPWTLDKKGHIRCVPEHPIWGYGTTVATMESSRHPNETKANADLICAAPDLLAYKRYVESNLESIERGGWTPVCFDEFITSEERETYGGAA